MKKKIEVDFSKKVFPIITMIIGAVIMLVQLITRQNLVAVVSVGYCCIMSAVILLSLIIKKKVYFQMILGYALSSFGTVLFHVIWGADAGFGAFTSGKAGWSTVEHTLMAGEGNLFTRLAGNILLVLPTALALWGLFLIARKGFKSEGAKKAVCAVMSVLLVGTSVFYVLTMNMRTKPVTERLWEGHDDYLKNVDKNTDGKPNVLVILMDDLGYSDISLNGAIYDTPSIDSIGENGLNFENFYSSYSVCSPARFAALTGRYPYRGYADNVIYPTVDCLSPFAQTRIFNSIEMLNNTDGMLGDEITIAETFKSAGYNTGCFGKWHLGDYGEYLPTNQGFDYFYGSHHVNDMVPFYHATEENGEYVITHGTDELKDQGNATKWIHEEITNWITDKVQNSDEPFFAYYTTPWPHAPVFVGDEFKGASGMGTYVDCVTEFDHYLGELFNTMEELGVLDDTIIVFTSDNGPALEGSTGELRGGKYLAYEGGQKVPFMIRWDNDNGALGEKGTRSQTATLVDLYPTLVDLCGITGNGGQKSYMPTDRTIDGVSMIPLLANDEVIHNQDVPILHMKRRSIKAIQYTVDTDNIKNRDEYKNYDYDVLKDNDYLTFKYFKRIQNDNSAFFDKYRKNWLHILTDDEGENYNRTPVYPEISAEMKQQLEEIQKDFEQNPRGIVK
ncbi:MAG: sulfatase-like hydrolase/transferase [Faecalibacterium sp.]|nr:sulfatase-like hydrolase/transferase [Ruminococcus sp.]MCM1393084.1 sulfatase-like hydrolase/transferase [Ruminococcus sp.]MCM1484806.1 sulfatase-like hydrolase/transferase [Faecalibacterium sp.]